jgi:hypothetical protein
MANETTVAADIDWKYVSSEHAVPLWYRESGVIVPLGIIALLPAPVAFLRLAAEKPSWFFWSAYLGLSLLFTGLFAISSFVLERQGLIRISGSSSIQYDAADGATAILQYIGVLLIPFAYLTVTVIVFRLASFGRKRNVS